MRSTFKILFYLKKNNPKPDGTVPAMCRITIDGTISQFSCKLTVLPHLWDTKAGRLTGKSTLAVKTNLTLDKIRGGYKPSLSRNNANRRFCYSR